MSCHPSASDSSAPAASAPTTPGPWRGGCRRPSSSPSPTPSGGARPSPRSSGSRRSPTRPRSSTTRRGRRGRHRGARPVHADLVVAAAAAGKGVFCEKPMAMTLAEADRAIDAAERPASPLQVGFNRRFAADFAAARAVDRRRRLGTPQLLRSVTRDPGLSNRRGGPAVDDLHRDPDPRLRRAAALNPGARPVEVYAHRRRAGRARLQGRRPARHRRRHDPLRQRRHRDGRGELRGHLRLRRARRGVRLGRHGHRGQPARDAHGVLRRRRHARSTPSAATPSCCPTPTPPSSRRSSAAVRAGARRRSTGADARAALADRPGRIESVETAGAPCDVRRVDAVSETPFRLAVSAEMVFVDLPFAERVRRIAERGFEVEIWDWTNKDVDALAAHRRHVLVDDRLHRRARSPMRTAPTSCCARPRSRSRSRSGSTARA